MERRVSNLLTGSLLILMGTLLILLAACGGGGGGGVEYDYGVMMTPDKTTVAPGGTVNLNVKYDAPPTNAGLTWSVNCTQSSCGSVSATGIYTAPAKVDEQMAVMVRATSNDQPSSSYLVTLWVTGPIVVRMTPSTDIGLNLGQHQSFSATVNAPDDAVIWKVNGIVGGNSTVGTITTAGLFTAPATVPDPDTVTVTAVAHVDQTASASIHVQIWPAIPVSVSVSPRDATVGTGGTVQYTATVTNTDDKVVQWKVNGTVGGNTTVGTITTGGLYTAPNAAPSPAIVSVTAVSHADNTKSDTVNLTIVGSNNSKLQGKFSFMLSGPNASGRMVAMIGMLIADGNGGLTGVYDSNAVGATNATIALSLSGTYSVMEDNRGRMTLNIAPVATYAFTLNDAGTSARLIQFDATGSRQTGTLEKASPDDFALSKIKGDYAFSALGSLIGGERTNVIGRFHTDGTGHISMGVLDVKESDESLQTVDNVTGEYSSPDYFVGRGNLNWILSATEAVHFSYYMTNAHKLLILGVEAVSLDMPLMVGSVVTQASGPFSATYLDGAGVFSLSGSEMYEMNYSSNIVGQWTATSSSRTLAGMYDKNAGGTVTTHGTVACTFNMTPNGRGTISGSGLPQMVFYMIDKNKALLMETSGSEGMVGRLEPQTTGTFNNAYLMGTFRAGPISAAVRAAALSQGPFVLDGSGGFTATEDVNDQSLSEVTLSGTYSVASSGRTELTVTAPEEFHYVAYPISATSLVGLSIENGDSKALVMMLEQ